jgi:hypothetical protein
MRDSYEGIDLHRGAENNACPGHGSGQRMLDVLDSQAF